MDVAGRNVLMASGIRFVMSGGAAPGSARTSAVSPRRAPRGPRTRGSLYHAVEITVSEVGAVSGRVIQAFDRTGDARMRFGDEA